jgi:EmrB/QacA subfamily drug resistance transporter
MATLDAGIVRIALPFLGHIFQAGPDTVVWGWLGYLLVSSSLLLTLGRTGDILGRKRLYISGLVIFSVGLGLCSLAQSLIQLMIFRLVQAVGTAMFISIGNAIITASFPAEERGRALGVMSAVAGVGQLSGPALGGILLDLIGWQSIFYIRLPIGIIGAAAAWFLLKEQSSPRQEGKFDLIGAATLFVTLTCLLLAVNRGQSLGWASPWVVGLGAMGVLLLFLFLFVEQKAVQPVLDLRLFRSHLLSAASSSHVLLYMTTTAVGFLMPFYLVQGLSLSASKAGLLLVAIPAVTLVVSPLSGRLSDRLGTLSLCASGLTIVSIGTFWLSDLGTNASIANVVLRLVVVGLGMGLFVSPNTSAIMGSVPTERLGTASAMVGTLRQVGMSIGLAIAGTVFAASQFSHANQLTSQRVPEDAVQTLSTIGGFHDAVFVALAIAIIGLVASVLRGKG